MNNARKALIDGSKNLNSVTAEIRRLETALDAAHTQAEEAVSALEPLSDLDTEIARWRASALRRGESTKKLPQALRDKQIARAAALEEVQLARETMALLDADCKAAKEEERRLQSGLAPIAVSVLQEELVHPMYKELATLQARVDEIETVLGAFRFWVEIDGRYCEIGYVERTQPDVGPSTFPASVSPREDQGKRWADLLDKLIVDPAIELQVPAVIQPTDYEWFGNTAVLKS